MMQKGLDAFCCIARVSELSKCLCQAGQGSEVLPGAAAARRKTTSTLPSSKGCQRSGLLATRCTNVRLSSSSGTCCWSIFRTAASVKGILFNADLPAFSGNLLASRIEAYGVCLTIFW